MGLPKVPPKPVHAYPPPLLTRTRHIIREFRRQERLAHLRRLLQKPWLRTRPLRQTVRDPKPRSYSVVDVVILPRDLKGIDEPIEEIALALRLHKLIHLAGEEMRISAHGGGGREVQRGEEAALEGPDGVEAVAGEVDDGRGGEGEGEAAFEAGADHFEFCFVVAGGAEEGGVVGGVGEGGEDLEAGFANDAGEAVGVVWGG